MKRNIIFLFVAATVINLSCKKFLNEVPSNIATLTDAFKTPASAYNFLASCYSYVPPINEPISGSMDAWSSDEIAIPWHRTSYQSWDLVTGQGSSSNPLFNLWGQEECMMV